MLVVPLICCMNLGLTFLLCEMELRKLATVAVRIKYIEVKHVK